MYGRNDEMYKTETWKHVTASGKIKEDWAVVSSEVTQNEWKMNQK